MMYPQQSDQNLDSFLQTAIPEVVGEFVRSGKLRSAAYNQVINTCMQPNNYNWISGSIRSMFRPGTDVVVDVLYQQIANLINQLLTSISNANSQPQMPPPQQMSLYASPGYAPVQRYVPLNQQSISPPTVNQTNLGTGMFGEAPVSRYATPTPIPQQANVQVVSNQPAASVPQPIPDNPPTQQKLFTTIKIAQPSQRGDKSMCVDLTKTGEFDCKPKCGNITAEVTTYQTGGTFSRNIVVAHSFKNLGGFLTAQDAIRRAKTLVGPLVPVSRLFLVEYYQLEVLPYSFAHVKERFDSLLSDIKNSQASTDEECIDIIIRNLEHGAEPGLCKAVEQLLLKNINMLLGSYGFSSSSVPNQTTKAFSLEDLKTLVGPVDPDENPAAYKLQNPDGYRNQYLEKMHTAISMCLLGIINNAKIYSPLVPIDREPILNSGIMEHNDTYATTDMISSLSAL